MKAAANSNSLSGSSVLTSDWSSAMIRDWPPTGPASAPAGPPAGRQAKTRQINTGIKRMEMERGLRDTPSPCDLLTNITPPTYGHTFSPKTPAGDLLAFAGAVREAKLIILSGGAPLGPPPSPPCCC